MPAAVEFVDIAGLVKGASQGEGLGNQFLANIREVDAIVHVVRCFEDPRRPARDGRRSIRCATARSSTSSWAWPTSPAWRSGWTRRPAPRAPATRRPSWRPRLLESVRDALAAGRPARAVVADRGGGCRLSIVQPADRQAGAVRRQRRARTRSRSGNRSRGGAPVRRSSATARAAEVVTFSAKVEAELAELPPEDRARVPRLPRRRPNRASTAWPTPPTICSASRAISPRARRRCGPGRSTAATRRAGAAGVIHSDFEKGFIRAETVGVRRLRARRRMESRPGSRGSPGRRARSTSCRTAT